MGTSLWGSIIQPIKSHIQSNNIYEIISVLVCVYVCLYTNYMCVLCLVAQSCPTLATPWTVALQALLSMGILQARRLEWVAMPFSRPSPRPRDGIHVSCVSCIAGRQLTAEPLGKPCLCRPHHLFSMQHLPKLPAASSLKAQLWSHPGTPSLSFHTLKVLLNLTSPWAEGPSRQGTERDTCPSS